MAEIRLTKSELRLQRKRLTQLERYLPTLHLKKAMLQTEVNEVKLEIIKLESSFNSARLSVSQSSSLVTDRFGFNIADSARVSRVEKRYENIAGVDVPHFEKVVFAPFDYPLFSTPPWLDAFVDELRKMTIAKAKVHIAQEKKKALERELREVTIRVNLFEKNLIPKAQKNIRKIKVFLGDQELAAVSQAKVAKTKIEEKKRLAL